MSRSGDTPAAGLCWWTCRFYEPFGDTDNHELLLLRMSVLFRRLARCIQAGSDKRALRSPSVCTLHKHSAVPCRRWTRPVYHRTGLSIHPHINSCTTSPSPHTPHEHTCCFHRGLGSSSVHIVGRCVLWGSHRSPLRLLFVCRLPGHRRCRSDTQTGRLLSPPVQHRGPGALHSGVRHEGSR